MGSVRKDLHHHEGNEHSSIVYVGNANGDLERCGTLREGGSYTSDTSGGLMRAASLILRIRPVFVDDDDDYNLNAVHNLREASFSIQKKVRDCLAPHFLRSSHRFQFPWWPTTLCGPVWGLLDALLLAGVLFWFRWGSHDVVGEPKNERRLSCPQQHTTSKRVTDHAGWTCDQCGKILVEGAHIDFCGICDWCVCSVCNGEQKLPSVQPILAPRSTRVPSPLTGGGPGETFHLLNERLQEFYRTCRIHSARP